MLCIRQHYEEKGITESCSRGGAEQETFTKLTAKSGHFFSEWKANPRNHLFKRCYSF